MRKYSAQIANVAAFLLMLLMNGLANGLPINGKTTGEISDAFPVLFTPAPMTFVIRGVIYLLLLAYVIYQILPAQHTALFQQQIGLWFVISCCLNAAWRFCWHYEQFVPTLLIMLGLLVSLWAIYRRLHIGRRTVPPLEWWFVHLPFSAYFGWISVATIANLTIVLATCGLGNLGLPPVLFTSLLMLFAEGLGIFMATHRNEMVYPLVIVWALIGIARRHHTTHISLSVIAAILASALVMVIVIVKLKNNGGRFPKIRAL
ncbi:tryptophan-rich sensory protein [candidate division KSB3 bacterium]|uniref:Tryptophan-rich sensory protein n=1 Tax=candidate division KSB3 bacterium TaxID=2044937 RepID=A0A2G6KIH0_9BACT|nr:MAG: tryptophan-rich sensory protein [candidate division KSB3 bacterium]